MAANFLILSSTAFPLDTMVGRLSPDEFTVSLQPPATYTIVYTPNEQLGFTITTSQFDFMQLQPEEQEALRAVIGDAPKLALTVTPQPNRDSEWLAIWFAISIGERYTCAFYNYYYFATLEEIQSLYDNKVSFGVDPATVTK